MYPLGSLVRPIRIFHPQLENNPWEDYSSISPNWKQDSLGIILDFRSGNMGEIWLKIYNSANQTGWTCSKFVELV